MADAVTIAGTFSHVLVLVVMPDGERVRVTIGEEQHAAIEANPQEVFQRGDWTGLASGIAQTVAGRYVTRFWFEDGVGKPCVLISTGCVSPAACNAEGRCRGRG